MAVILTPSTTLAILVISLLSACVSGDFCYDSDTGHYDQYCAYGCCGILDDDCCAGVSVGLIAGVTCGSIAIVLGVIAAICIRRRRLYGGFIYTNQGPSTTMVQSNSNSMMSSGGVYNIPQGQGYGNPGYAQGPAPPPYGQVSSTATSSTAYSNRY